MGTPNLSRLSSTNRKQRPSFLFYEFAFIQYVIKYVLELYAKYRYSPTVHQHRTHSTRLIILDNNKNPFETSIVIRIYSAGIRECGSFTAIKKYVVVRSWSAMLDCIYERDLLNRGPRKINRPMPMSLLMTEKKIK